LLAIVVLKFHKCRSSSDHSANCPHFKLSLYFCLMFIFIFSQGFLERTFPRALPCLRRSWYTSTRLEAVPAGNQTQVAKKYGFLMISRLLTDPPYYSM
jgi:hypothetical protein